MAVESHRRVVSLPPMVRRGGPFFLVLLPRRRLSVTSGDSRRRTANWTARSELQLLKKRSWCNFEGICTASSLMDS